MLRKGLANLGHTELLQLLSDCDFELFKAARKESWE